MTLMRLPRAVHFLVIGALLFAAFNTTSPRIEADRPVISAASTDEADDEILLREALAARLDEHDKVVRERLVGLGRDLRLAAAEDEGGLEREARAVGLHHSDPLIRRHLIDMMRLAAGAPGADAVAGDAELRVDYDAQPSRVALPPRVSFRHVYLSRAQRGAALERDAAATLADLRASSASAASAGDAFVTGTRVRGASASAIARRFGPAFAARVLTLPEHQWSGPLESPYGLHLVYVEQHVAAAPAPFMAVRSRLLHARLREQSARRLRATLDILRTRYDVRIAPAAAAGR